MIGHYTTRAAFRSMNGWYITFEVGGISEVAHQRDPRAPIL